MYINERVIGGLWKSSRLFTDTPVAFDFRPIHHLVVFDIKLFHQDLMVFAEFWI